MELGGGDASGDCSQGRREDREGEVPVTVNDVGPEATGCAVCEDHKDFCDPVREELRGVGKMPRLPREQRHRFTDREGEATESVK